MNTACEHNLTEALDGLMDLRPFPATASLLMTACEQPETTARDIAAIIRHDPGLSMRIVQIANSPMYGFSGAIRSVDHATVVLGFRAVRDTAVSLSVGKVFSLGNDTTKHARQSLWAHSIACGSIAATLADVTGICPTEEAFLAGIVHDVGKLLILDHQPEVYSGMLDPATGSSVERETQTFGIDHAAVGHRCGEHWGLPEEINDVICFHHHPQKASFDSEMVKLVRAANMLTRVWGTDQSDACAASCEILSTNDLSLSAEEINELEQRATADMNAVFEAYSK